jgi:cytochrome b involved in lipid metabolism
LAISRTAAIWPHRRSPVSSSGIRLRWRLISGLVYDLTEFLWHHPGGARLIKLNAGLDATRSYEKVGHHQDPEVNASLDLYKIGKIRRLGFGGRWAVTILPDSRSVRPETATACVGCVEVAVLVAGGPVLSAGPLSAIVL